MSDSIETEAAEYIRCPDCGGFGVTAMNTLDDCERCSGTGTILATSARPAPTLTTKEQGDE